ncbi:tubulin polyglutamylase ttll4 isoform x2: PROVISIONAL [Gigaspora margarita]|uniref:Tubulin polyglutamylase ttll4 isoform x2: PROVISIONAL n=1 Tax=Gigaspora margarita TaxID=4874 RepID=A0A8H4A653_GIGMA|nr:tubulin polyglutamylase ttll4 isoform x2: PROVISIONAL [Gigaspora margarita]
MSKQSKQPTKRSARLLQRTNKPEFESLVHDKPQEHQSSLLSQPLVSIELSEPSQVHELVERHPNIHLPRRLSQMASESSDIIKSEDFDRIKEENRQLCKKVDDLESENRSLNEEMGVLIQINELFDKESIVFQNQIKELEMKLKIANQEKGKSRADKLLELPVKAFNISNKNEESYFYVDEDEVRDKETTQLKQASNKKAEHEKIASDDDNSDSKGARDELKSIYKNVPKMYKLKADQVFTSENNQRVLAKLIPELVKLMAPKFTPLQSQLRKWLKILHRHQRERFIKKQSGKLDEDNRRLHVNNRVTEYMLFYSFHIALFLEKNLAIKECQITFARNNKRVRGHNKNEVLALLLNTEVHSPEISETDEDSQEKKRKIIVYNYSWRSLELKELLRNTLDEHSKLGLGSSQSHPRNYDDSRFFYVVSHPKDIPSWAYITSESENEKVSETSSKRRRVTDYDRSIMYSRNSELETGESSTIGMIWGALNDDGDNDDDINEEDSNYS